MTREDIIRMAREAGFELADNATDEALNRFSAFAALVAAAERAECAQVCRSEMARAIYNLDNDLGINRNFWNGGSEIASSCAASITARGNS